MAEPGPHDPFVPPRLDATAPTSFASFLERMRQTGAADVVKSIKAFLADFSSSLPDRDGDEARVQHFLSSTEAGFRAHPLWRGASEEELEASGEGLEKYLMTKLHARTFGVLEEEKERDAALSLRFEALQFLRPEHLDIPEQHRRGRCV